MPDDLAAEIKKILDKHESRFRLEPRSAPNEELEKARLERQREFWLMSTYLTTGIEEGEAEELKHLIADKLALGSLQRIGRNDWWWSPADDLVASTLREVQRTLEKAEKKKTWDRLRKFRWVWWVLRELIYLAIVISLFSVAHSKFETLVAAALVLIYNELVVVKGAVVMAFVYLAHTAEVIYWEFGRTLKLKVPISRLTEAKAVLGDLTAPSLIRNISIGIGSLIALWHLVIALLG